MELVSVNFKTLLKLTFVEPVFTEECSVAEYVQT